MRSMSLIPLDVATRLWGRSLVARSEVHPVQDALAWGNAAGALAAQRSGAMPSLPLRADVIALAKQPARVVG